MKLLSITAYNFKNCADNFTVDFVPKSKKTSEDKEYELQEIAEGLYTYNTAAFIGKNASGKTSVIELLDCCYSILGNFSLENKSYSYDNVSLKIFFYHDDYIYRYETTLKSSDTTSEKANFINQKLLRKKYYKTKVNQIFDNGGFENVSPLGELPEDTSVLFFVLKKKATQAVYFNCNGEGADTYRLLFRMLSTYKLDTKLLSAVIRIFDDSIKGFEMIDEHNYKLYYFDSDAPLFLSDKELIYRLSSGTTKGMLLYMMMAASLKNGFDLIIDEIENHFHKTLVDNMLSLYKDKKINRHNATLCFSTHYCELLDHFNRQDNIWICKNENKVSVYNMQEHYGIRSELLKSKQFHNNTFGTAVNYEDMMTLKKELR